MWRVVYSVVIRRNMAVCVYVGGLEGEEEIPCGLRDREAVVVIFLMKEIC